MMRKSSISTLALAAALLLTAPLPSPVRAGDSFEAAVPGSILVLHSGYRGDPFTDLVDAGFRQALAAAGRAPEIWTEYLGLPRARERRYREALVSLLEAKYSGRRFDAVVTSGKPALELAMAHRHRSPFNASLVFAGIDAGTAARFQADPKLTGMVASTDLSGTLDVAMSLHPRIERVVVISPDVEGHQDVAPFAAADPKLKVEVWHDALLADIERRLESLGSDAIVVPLGAPLDAAASPVGMRKLAGVIVDHTHAPVYTPGDLLIGHGAVGGYVTDTRAHGAAAGKTVLQVLGGDGTLPPLTTSPMRYLFDHRQLTRFGVPSSALPPDSRIINAPPRFFEVERDTLILVLAVLVALLAAVVVLSLNILHRRRMQRVVSESERRLDLALQVSQDGLWDWNMVTGECYYSPRWYEAMSLKPARVPGHVSGWEDRVHPEDLEGIRVKVSHHLAGASELYESEHRVMHGDGKYRWHRVRGKVVARTDSGRPVRMIGVESDVTDRRETERALREKQGQLDAIFENSPAEIFLKDAEGRYVRISREFARRFGVRNRDVVGKFPRDIHDESLATFSRDHDLEVLNTAKPVLREERFRRSEGDQEHVYFTLKFPTFDEKGEVAGIGAIATDVTELKRAERELAERERLLRLVYDHVPILLAYVDRDLRFRIANREAERWYRRPLDQIIGHRVEEVVGPEAWRDVEPEIDRASAGETVTVDAFRPYPGGARWATGSVAPNFDEDGEVQGYCVMLADITERKQAEEKLKANEQFLRLVYDHVPVWLAYVDKDLRYRLINREAAEWLEMSAGEVVGRTVPEVLGEASYEAVRHLIDRALKGELVVREGKVNFGGKARWVSGIYVPHRDDKGGIRGYVALLSDISARKRTEDELKAREKQLRLIADNVSAMLAYVDVDHRYRFVNKRFVDFFGRPADEVIGAHVSEIIGEQTYEKIRAQIEQCLTGRTVSFEEIRYPAGEQARWISATYVSDRDRDGNTVGCFALLSDVTERRAKDEALRLSEARMRAIFEHSPIAINLKDRDGKYLLTNKKWEHIIGKDGREPASPSLEDVLPPEVAKSYRDQEREVLESGQAVEREVTFRTPRHGERTYHIIKFPILDDDGDVTGLGGMSMDITERNRALEALADSEERYQGLYDDAPDMYFTITADGNILSVNQFGADYLGFSKEQLIDTSVLNLVHPEDQRMVSDHIAKVFNEGVKESQLEFRKIRRDGGVLWVHERIRLSDREENGTGELRIVCRDVTEAHALSEELSYQASHDPLTGLFNRRELESRLERVLRSAQASRTEHALCYMDLDQFKVINDTCGHIAGDELLRQLGELLPGLVRKRDTLARLGGDEFALLMEHCAIDQAKRVAGILRSTVEEFRFTWEEKTFSIGASIGLVPINAESRSVGDILSAADTACYMAKDQGRNRIYLYDTASIELARRHGEMEWVAHIGQALEEDRFELWYQEIRARDPNVDPAGIYYELLLRMKDAKGKLVFPGAFLPAAERYNLSGRIDRWVVTQAFAWLKANPRHLDELYLCAINLSGLSLTDGDFHRFVLGQFNEMGIPGSKICFELTETAAITNLSSASRFISAVKSLGCKVALDDFGSGISSFAYLKHLAVDSLKIDGVFVKDIVDDPIDYAMVKSINEIGRVMGKKTVAEFVENEAVLAKLGEIGVDFVQGFGIGRPARLAGRLNPPRYSKQNRVV